LSFANFRKACDYAAQRRVELAELLDVYNPFQSVVVGCRNLHNFYGGLYDGPVDFLREDLTTDHSLLLHRVFDVADLFHMGIFFGDEIDTGLIATYGETIVDWGYRPPSDEYQRALALCELHSDIWYAEDNKYPKDDVQFVRSVLRIRRYSKSRTKCYAKLIASANHAQAIKKGAVLAPNLPKTAEELAIDDYIHSGFNDDCKYDPDLRPEETCWCFLIEGFTSRHNWDLPVKPNTTE